MPDPLLVTKISLPILRHILVPRKKVLRQLSEGIRDGHLLTLVSAPAGYGKTTTIRMWVKETGHPVAWVALENSDNDLRQFLTYFLTALQQAGIINVRPRGKDFKNPRRIIIRPYVRY
jgi:LuxR family maltose regulon positive regulatory protein